MLRLADQRGWDHAFRFLFRTKQCCLFHSKFPRNMYAIALLMGICILRGRYVPELPSYSRSRPRSCDAHKATQVSRGVFDESALHQSTELFVPSSFIPSAQWPCRTPAGKNRGGTEGFAKESDVHTRTQYHAYKEERLVPPHLTSEEPLMYTHYIRGTSDVSTTKKVGDRKHEQR